MTRSGGQAGCRETVNIAETGGFKAALRGAKTTLKALIVSILIDVL